MIGNFQIRVLNSSESGITIHRTYSFNCTHDCSQAEKDKYVSYGVTGFYIQCYLMASYSNGVEVAQGSFGNFTLVSPFDQELSDFNCTGINNC